MSDARNGVRTLVVGAGSAGTMAAVEMAGKPEHGYVVVGFLDDDPGKLGDEIGGAPVLGRIADLVAVAKKHDVDEVVIAITSA